jgi:regulator of cell morphogenesis and NO signaling
MIYRETNRMSDLLTQDRRAMQIVNRFGIPMGVGDKTIAAICAEHGLDRDFFATIINTYLNEDYFPDRILASMDAQLIISYLQRTNAYYEQFQLPNIERHFQLLLARSAGGSNNLDLIYRFFVEVRDGLLARIEHDRQEWFPQVLNLESLGRPAAVNAVMLDEGDNSIEAKIDDLITMIVVHLSGQYDANLALAVLLSISGLRKDIAKNNRIRNRILKPLSDALTQKHA